MGPSARYVEKPD